MPGARVISRLSGSQTGLAFCGGNRARASSSPTRPSRTTSRRPRRGRLAVAVAREQASRPERNAHGVVDARSAAAPAGVRGRLVERVFDTSCDRVDRVANSLTASSAPLSPQPATYGRVSPSTASPTPDQTMNVTVLCRAWSVSNCVRGQGVGLGRRQVSGRVTDVSECPQGCRRRSGSEGPEGRAGGSSAGAPPEDPLPACPRRAIGWWGERLPPPGGGAVACDRSIVGAADRSAWYPRLVGGRCLWRDAGPRGLALGPSIRSAAGLECSGADAERQVDEISLRGRRCSCLRLS
jgi:hypothetical protein